MKIIDRFARYLREVRAEAVKVNWPTRQETIRFTIMVIIVSAFVGAFLSALDYLFLNILERII